MTESQDAQNTGDHRPDDAPQRILTDPAVLQTGAHVSIARALELAVALDHLKRDAPALLTALRVACVRPDLVKAAGDEIAALHALGLTTEKVTPLADTETFVRAAVRGVLGAEQIDNPFLDSPSRTLFDYLRNGAVVTMQYAPAELKAIHENETVAGLMAEAPDSTTWAGYVRNRGQDPGQWKGAAPSAN